MEVIDNPTIRRDKPQGRKAEKEEQGMGKNHTTSSPKEGFFALFGSDLCLDCKAKTTHEYKKKNEDKPLNKSVRRTRE